MSDELEAEVAASLAALEGAVLRAAGIAEGAPYEFVFDVEFERGMRGVTFEPGRPAFEITDEVDLAREVLAAALDLKRPGMRTRTRIRLVSGHAPVAEPTRADALEPDPSEVRFDAWHGAFERHLAARLPGADLSLGYGTVIGYRLGGPDPLRYVTTVRREEPVPHWLYVTRGFSEPWDDAANEPEGPSAYGFELTLRVPRERGDNGDAPVAFVTLLQSLARYVFATGNVFRDGDYTQLEEPLGGISAFGFVADADLGELRTPAGTVAFRSAVGLDEREIEAVKLWNTYGIVDLAVAMGKLSPNRITVPGRPSFLDDPAFAAAARAGGAREGSRTGSLFMPDLNVRAVPRFLRSPAYVVTLDPASPGMAPTLLPNRVVFGRALTLVGQRCSVRFEPAERTALAGDAAELRVGITADEALALATAAANGAARYEFRDVPLTVVLRQ